MSIMGTVLLGVALGAFVAVMRLVFLRLGMNESNATLITLGLAVAATWGYQKFFVQSDLAMPTEVQRGQSLRAPVQEQVLVQPLLTEVDFADAPADAERKIEVENERVKITFSTHGAVMSHLSCKRMLDGVPGIITLWDTNVATEREQGAFLLAFERVTPLNYSLISDTTTDAARTLLFSAQSADATVEKTFVIYADSYRVDVTITIKPQSGATVKPRLLVPAPFMTELPDDAVRGLVINERNALEKLQLSYVEGRLWVMPSLFGAEDRYFIAALVDDAKGFTQRAYYRPQGTKRLTTIVEGPAITEETSWKMGWYCGPKQEYDMAQIDKRLVATLDYGWLTPISSSLFALLFFIHGFVHNYGWAIIILTILLKLIMLPLTIRADRSQKKMMEVQKKLQFIDRKYKDNRELRDQERVELIRKHGMGSMLGLGFLPRLLQIFIFFGLNRVLSVAIELYRAPFIGWIQNLALPDPLYLFPIATGIGLFIQLRAVEDARQLLTATIMSVVITGIMVNLAAGVVMFVCISTWIDILVGSLTKRRFA